MAQILGFRTSVRGDVVRSTHRPSASSVVLAVSVPVLAAMLSVGMVDACAYAQHSLLGLYGVAASAPV